MDINLNINSPVVTKFIEVVASGISEMVGPVLARRMAKAEADNIRLIAEAQRDAMKALKDVSDDDSVSVKGDLSILHGRAKARMYFQEEKRQHNIENVVCSAASQLPEQTTDQDVDPDWTARFFENVKDVSTERMQQIWAKILAGEVGAPGRTSLKTLDVLKNLTKRDAMFFSWLVSAFAIDNDFIYYPRSFDQEMVNQIMSFSDFLDLGDAGLVYSEMNITRPYHIQQSQVCGFRYRGFFLEFELQKGISSKEIKIPVICLTRAGREIAGFVENSIPKVKYIYSLSRFLESNNATMFVPYSYNAQANAWNGRYNLSPATPESEIKIVHSGMMGKDGKTPTAVVSLVTADNTVLQTACC